MDGTGVVVSFVSSDNRGVFLVAGDRPCAVVPLISVCSRTAGSLAWNEAVCSRASRDTRGVFTLGSGCACAAVSLVDSFVSFDRRGVFSLAVDRVCAVAMAIFAES